MNVNYYAIIPASVRYNKELTMLERFLYAELTALSNVDGYCIARNDYFANLYEKDKATISRAFSKLENLGLITIDYDRVGCKVTKRKIYLSEVKTTNDKIVNRSEITNDKNITREQEKLLLTIDKIVKENNVSYNNILSLIMYNIPKPLNDILKEHNFSKELEDKIYLWLQYKKEKKQSYTQTGFRSLLNSLQKSCEENGEQFVIDSIESSMASNYQGIYAPKEQIKRKENKEVKPMENQRQYTDDYLDSLLTKV